MQRFLIDHALSNVWCNPDQDNQIILSATRLTADNGVLNNFVLMNKRTPLPTTGKRYHVYQIGQILPVSLGLKPITVDWEPEKWIKFSDAMSVQKVLVNLYTSEGINIPRFSSYYMFSNDRDLVFAVELDSTIPINYNVDTVFLRLYSNAFYQSIQGDAINDYIYCTGAKILNMQQILDYQDTVATLRNKPGLVTCYVNGLLTNDINPVTTAIGNSVEYVYDSSVKRTVTFTINSLQSFTSILDNKFKYLLHHLEGNNDTIDYQDDIDINIIYLTPNGTSRGVYYHRNNPDSHRMVTHRDYSVIVDYVNFLANALKTKLQDPTLATGEFKLQIIIRNSGYLRPLLFDNSRIFELYKLSPEKIQRALTGVNATLDIWKAENLENNAYCRLMRSKIKDVTLPLVQDAYGYNSISKIIADTPSFTVNTSNQQVIELPIGLRDLSTAYEYDVDGKLLRFNQRAVTSEYVATDSGCRLVEVISGTGTKRPEVIFGTDLIALPSYDNYRVYMCFLDNGLPNNIWRDVTGTDQYRVENSTLIWNNLQYGQFLMVRTDKTFLAYDIDLTSVNGNLSFELSEEEDRGDGFKNYSMPVPAGELDIFMNGNALIEGLDYVVIFPEVHILNKSYLEQPVRTEVQKVHVRFTGFCDRNLKTTRLQDFGFIQHGFLSNNSRFDIRDDKVLRITVDGSTKHRSDLQFSELHDGVSITNPNNGKPYQVKDVVVPLKQLVLEDTYSLRDKSLVIDRKVSDYLTINLPEPLRGELLAIPNKYVIVSPFFSRIINALTDNEIANSVVQSNLSDMDVIELCQQFEYLLACDPINLDNKHDFRFIKVVPHYRNAVITLSLAQYRLLTRIVKLYGNDLVDLTNYVNFNS